MSTDNKKVLLGLAAGFGAAVVLFAIAAAAYWFIWPKIKGDESKETQQAAETESEAPSEAEPEAEYTDAEGYMDSIKYLNDGVWIGYLEKSGKEEWEMNYRIDGVQDMDCYLAAFPYDFDGDGEKEVLLVDQDENRQLKLKMMTFPDGKPTESGTFFTGLTISDCLSYGEACDEQDIYLFTDGDGKTRLAIESSGCEGLRADGTVISFETLAFEGGKFVSLGTAGYSGSDGENNGMTADVEKLIGVKVNWRELFSLSHRISDYVNDYQDIVHFTTNSYINSDADQEEYWAWRESGTEPFEICNIQVGKREKKEQIKASDYDFASAYIDYIKKAEKRTDYEAPAGYDLFFVDWSCPPLLYVQGQSTAAGDQLISFKDGKITETYFYNYGLTYIPEDHVFADHGGHMDEYYHTIYTLEDGEVKVIASGTYGAEDNANLQFDEAGEPIYQYFWNEKPVTKEEYDNELKKVYDYTAVCNPDIQSASEMIELLEEY